jgi:hypothetical protein
MVMPRPRQIPIPLEISTKINPRTGRPYSRQRQLQMAWKLMGLCILCGKPAFTGTHCLKHGKDNRANSHRKHAKDHEVVVPKNSIWKRVEARVAAEGPDTISKAREIYEEEKLRQHGGSGPDSA